MVKCSVCGKKAGLFSWFAIDEYFKIICKYCKKAIKEIETEECKKKKKRILKMREKILKEQTCQK